jgi:hypothetical protein
MEYKMSAAVIIALDGVLANHEYRCTTEGTDVLWQEECAYVRIEENAPNRDMVPLCQQS